MNPSPESMRRPPHAWLGDSPERQTESAPHAKEVVSALGAKFHGGHAEQVWQHGVQEVLPRVIEE